MLSDFKRWPPLPPQQALSAIDRASRTIARRIGKTPRPRTRPPQGVAAGRGGSSRAERSDAGEVPSAARRRGRADAAGEIRAPEPRPAHSRDRRNSSPVERSDTGEVPSAARRRGRMDAVGELCEQRGGGDVQAQRASIAPSNHSTPSAASPEGLNHEEHEGHEGINARLMRCGGDTLKGSDPSKQLRSRRGLFVLFVVNSSGRNTPRLAPQAAAWSRCARLGARLEEARLGKKKEEDGRWMGTQGVLATRNPSLLKPVTGRSLARYDARQ